MFCPKESCLCEISALRSKIEEISNSFSAALNNLKHKNNKTTDISEKISLLSTTTTAIQGQTYQIINGNSTILETISVHCETEKSNETVKNFLQHELFSKSQEKAHNSSLPYPTSQRKQVTLEKELVNLEHKRIRNRQSQKETHNKTQGVQAKKL